MTGLTAPLVIGGSAGKGKGYKRVIMAQPKNFNQPQCVSVSVCVVPFVSDTSPRDADQKISKLYLKPQNNRTSWWFFVFVSAELCGSNINVINIDTAFLCFIYIFFKLAQLHCKQIVTICSV